MRKSEEPRHWEQDADEGGAKEDEDEEDGEGDENGALATAA
jgi:hypothetical protein